MEPKREIKLDFPGQKIYSGTLGGVKGLAPEKESRLAL
jgi:hypothetical protein